MATETHEPGDAQAQREKTYTNAVLKIALLHNRAAGARLLWSGLTGLLDALSIDEALHRKINDFARGYCTALTDDVTSAEKDVAKISAQIEAARRSAS